MSTYNERPKGDVRPVAATEKEKVRTSPITDAERNKEAESSGSQDARRHAELMKHGKR